ncbi:MAG: hypothetical protein ACR2P6_04300, partial [Gammaproteobacteria bacterium]
QEALWRCLKEGVRRVDSATHAELEQADGCFRVVPWSYIFYGEHGDIEIDQAGIERVLHQQGPTSRDVSEARPFGRWLDAALYAIGDALPWLTRLFVTNRMETRLTEIRRYFHNENEVGDQIRGLVQDHVRAALDKGHKLMLVGHSFGAVIAFDALWDLSRRKGDSRAVDLFVSMGSPLGLRFIREHLLGAHEAGPHAYPDNIGRWLNITALGESAAGDRSLHKVFGAMLDYDLVDEIDDHDELINTYRGEAGLNVHKCYGYFANQDTGRYVSAWWKGAAEFKSD